MQRSIAAAALVVGMLVTVPFVPGATVAADPAGKYDTFLVEALEGNPEYARWADAQGRFEVLLSGAPHVAPDVMPASRDGWNQYWSAEAAGFIAQVRGALRPGDELMSVLPIVPMVKVKATPARIAELASLPLVEGAGLDWPEAVRVLGEVPEGPGVAMGQSVGMTQAFDLHALGFMGQGIKLAVIDTGIEYMHPMFLDEFGQSRVTDFFDATASGCATHCDTNGHGTHTASTAAGSNVAGGRHQGVAPRAEIQDVKIFIGGSGSWEDAQEGLQAAFDLGADLTSNSWGGGCGSVGSGGELTERVAKNTALAGLQHVFSSGNSGSGSAATLCPSRNDLVLAVGAVDKSKVIAGFSSGGLCPDANGVINRICPDVVAVGVNVEAAYLNGGYSSLSGTSMAAPHVAGGAALMLQMANALQAKAYHPSTQELEQFFEGKAEDLGAPGNDQRYGHGFIRLARMGDDLLPGAEGRATVDVSVSRAEMRVRDTNVASLMLNNVGSKTLTGTARITAGGELEHDGATYLEQAITLAPGEQRVLTASIPGADLDPTTYHVVGGFEYTYQHSVGGTVGTTVEDFTTFILRGVKMGVTRASTPQAFGGNGLWSTNSTQVTLTLRNIGNEPATNVDLREGIPFVGYAIEPRTSANPQTPLSALSAPAPNSAAPNAESKTLDLTYTPASVGAGQTFQVQYRLRAVTPGTYDFVAHVSYTDAIGDEFEQTLTQQGTVRCPGVRFNPVIVPPAC
jgi:subtilisin family serine protease